VVSWTTHSLLSLDWDRWDEYHDIQVARAHNGLGAALLAAGPFAQACAQHEAALVLASQSGDWYERARAHAA
jgi:hypothetical protein